MGVAFEVLHLQPHDLHQFHDPLLQFGRFRQIVLANRLGDDVQHGHARVKRGVGVLKNHVEVTTQAPQFTAVEAGQVLYAAIRQAQQDETVVGVDAANDATPEGGLAATRLTDQAEGLSFPDIETDVIDRAHLADLAAQQAFLDREEFSEVADLQQHFAARRFRHGAVPRP